MVHVAGLPSCPQLFEKENAYEVFKHQQAEKEKVLKSQVRQRPITAVVSAAAGWMDLAMWLGLARLPCGWQRWAGIWSSHPALGTSKPETKPICQTLDMVLGFYAEGCAALLHLDFQGASEDAIEAQLAPSPDDPQPLSEEELAERQKLLESGFKEWGRK